jgi:hypothetical protein
MKEHIYSRERDSAKNYRNAFEVHILPRVGGVLADLLADLLTREDARSVMNEARKKRKRQTGGRGGQIGGIEAARTTMSVLRHMYSWAIDERKVKRMDNPCAKITKNLPKRRQGDVVLSLREARIVWQAAADIGYPFGTHAQLMMLNRLSHERVGIGSGSMDRSRRKANGHSH